MKKLRIKYLSNKELLLEIHNSKKTYCYYVDETYSNFDYIVTSLDDITDEIIEEAKIKRAKRLKEHSARELLIAGENPKKHDIDIDPSTIKDEDLVFRLMTYDHIPLDLERKKTHKTEADRRVKLPFSPFKHFVLKGDELVEVGRSHWINGLHNGEFSLDYGNISNRLAKMFMKLVFRYSLKPNWRGYSYLDEMRSEALLQLSRVGLKFDENRSDNPFAFYTQCVKSCFIGNLNYEKKCQNLRDELLLSAGAMPSHSAIINELWEASNRQVNRPGSPKKGNAHIK